GQSRRLRPVIAPAEDDVNPRSLVRGGRAAVFLVGRLRAGSKPLAAPVAHCDEPDQTPRGYADAEQNAGQRGATADLRAPLALELGEVDSVGRGEGSFETVPLA